MNSVTTKEAGQEGKEQDTGTGGDVAGDSTAASSPRNYNTVTGLCRTMACVFGWPRTGRTAPQLRRIFGFCWPIIVWLISTAEELWITIAFLATGWMDELLPCLTLAAIFLSCNGIVLVYYFLVVCHQKIRALFGGKDYIRWMCFGDDYWTPLPNYEWGDAPLNITMCNWNLTEGWGTLDSSVTDNAVDFLKDDGDSNLQPFMRWSDQHKDKDTQSFDSEATTTTEQYEAQYISRQKHFSEPALIVNICYLLEKICNNFLYESVEWLTAMFTCPIHLTMNARGEGIERAWVPEKIHEVQNYLLEHYLGQVQATFSDSSRSKAENCNLFGEVVSVERFDYALRLDIDDRPTYSERSLVECANELIGTIRNGFTIVGLQGACVECYESRAGLGGFMECHTEWAEHMEKDQTRARIMGHIWHEGSNMIAETWVFKKYVSNPSLLLEDKEWTLKLLRDGNALAYFPLAVSYGQLPSSFGATQKRRKRWMKGGMQLAFHVMKHVPMSYFTRYFHCWAYAGVFAYFVWLPMLNALILFGFGVIGRKCQSQTGSVFFLDPDLTEAELKGGNGVRILVWLWNWLGPTTLFAFVVVVVGHFVNTLKFWHRGRFVNARKGYKWFWLQFGYILLDVVSLLFPLVRLRTQEKQYYQTQMLLDFILCRTPTWEVTEKSAMCKQNEVAHALV